MDDTKRIKELILEDLKAFTSDDVEELEDLLNSFIDRVTFAKAWIKKTKTGSGLFNSMLKKLPLPEMHLNLPNNVPSENIKLFQPLIEPIKGITTHQKEIIQNLSKFNEVNTDRIKDLIDLERFTSDDIEELKDLLKKFNCYLTFLKTMIELRFDESDEDSD